MESLSSSSGLGSTTNNEQDDEEEEEEDDDAASSVGEAMTDEEAIARLVPLALPEALRSVIEKDFFYINEKNKVSLQQVRLLKSFQFACGINVRIV